jgi:hypothetical protein
MRTCVTRHLAAFALLGLAGCALAPAQPLALSIRGELLLPSSTPAKPSEMVVELRDTTNGRVLTEQRQPLRGHASALPFRLQLARDRLTPGHAFSVRGAVLAEGWAQWLSEPVTIDPDRGTIDLGTLMLARAQRPLAFQTRIDCAGRIFIVGMAGSVLTLRDGETSVELKPAASAPDERFEAVGDASTFVHTQGQSATVGVGGAVYAGCRTSR